MKYIVLRYLICFFIPFGATIANGVPKVRLSDSVAYELQRTKVNSMLDARKSKFGEYDLSLRSKTGIFGIFKTKGDMQRSIDILKQIVLTDNAIFIETKKLLEMKDFEKERFRNLAEEYDTQRDAYMKTVSKLQQENARLRSEVAELEKQRHHNDIANYYSLITILALLIVVIWQYLKFRSKKLTKL